MTRKISGIVVSLATFCTAAAIEAQSMFRGDAMHSGTYAGPAPRQFHRVKWKFPTGDRVISSPVFKDNVIYFGGDDGNVYALDSATATCVGNSKPVMLCTPRLHLRTAFCFSEAGTAISTPWTLRQEKRNGDSMEAKTR